VAGYRDPIEQAGYAVDRIDVSDPAFGSLDLREPDLLIMMGGPMGVYEHEAHPWIRCQMRRLALRLEADRPTLGVCFGAQMIAAAMGSDVYPGGAGKWASIRSASTPGTARCAMSKACRCCTGMAIRSICPKAWNCWRRATSIATRRSGAAQSAGAAIPRGDGRGPRFDAWIEQSPDDVAAAGHSPETLRAAHEAHGPGAVSAGRRMIGMAGRARLSAARP
jgi:GMP synthase (glutamine-hydrolysing)